MILIKERIGKLVEDLKNLIYVGEVPITGYRMLRSGNVFRIYMTFLPMVGKSLLIENCGVVTGNISGLRQLLPYLRSFRISVSCMS